MPNETPLEPHEEVPVGEGEGVVTVPDGGAAAAPLLDALGETPTSAADSILDGLGAPTPEETPPASTEPTETPAAPASETPPAQPSEDTISADEYQLMLDRLRSGADDDLSYLLTDEERAAQAQAAEAPSGEPIPTETPSPEPSEPGTPAQFAMPPLPAFEIPKEAIEDLQVNGDPGKLQDAIRSHTESAVAGTAEQIMRVMPDQIAMQFLTLMNNKSIADGFVAANPDIGEMYKNDPELFLRGGRLWTSSPNSTPACRTSGVWNSWRSNFGSRPSSRARPKPRRPQARRLT